MKPSEELIKKIVESIDAGFVCYVNPNTGEMEETRENDDFDFDMDEDDDDFTSEPEWQKEMRKEMKKQTKRIDL